MFLGTFLSYDTSFDATPVSSETSTAFEIKNGIFDEVYLSSDTNNQFNATIPEWGYDTILHARFQNNILAGNVDFTLDSISKLIIKKRKEGSYKWVQLYETTIDSEEDFDFYMIDVTVASMTNYDYAAVPIINGVEGTYQITSIYVEFDGAFIVDPTNAYQLIANLQRPSLTRNNPSNVLEPVNSKYPYINYYSNLQYDRFSVSGLFIRLNRTTCQFETDHSWRLRKEVRDFLTNKRSKIVKFWNGEIYMAAVVDPIQENVDGHPDNVNMTINFVEVGDVDDPRDLYYNGFTSYLEVGV